ncbi:uncharacterized protein SOCEGT47_001260 [Sorangium cellulosum]|uniref:Secreted protein n=1 Tax=Sorangium cellulosum TaxID=56 RepID=A0A4P2PSY9_SORCE|nr:hypothetical protein [Sorangium cellulosum]AUX19674.1 uncharacterized protein SOCEGT47_001260 [Sorangium cellulosum]
MRRRWLIMALALASLGACTAGTHTREEFDEAFPFGRMSGLRPEVFAEFKAELEGALGRGLRVRRVGFGPDTMQADVQNPKRRTHLDRYVYHDRELSDPSPVSLSNTEEATLDGALFELGSVPVKILPRLAREAHRELGIEQSWVEHVGISRAGDGSSALTILVSVRSPRKSGSAMFDGEGRLVRAQRH